MYVPSNTRIINKRPDRKETILVRNGAYPSPAQPRPSSSSPVPLSVPLSSPPPSTGLSNDANLISGTSADKEEPLGKDQEGANKKERLAKENEEAIVKVEDEKEAGDEKEKKPIEEDERLKHAEEERKQRFGMLADEFLQSYVFQQFFLASGQNEPRSAFGNPAILTLLSQFKTDISPSTDPEQWLLSNASYVEAILDSVDSRSRPEEGNIDITDADPTNRNLSEIVFSKGFSYRMHHMPYVVRITFII